MGYNPHIHGTGSERTNRNRRPRRFDPRAGIKHSAITGQHGPVGISPVDIQNREVTSSGWRIPYFEGEAFEVYYELICARNSSGKIRNQTKDRCIRVLAGTLFVVSDGNINQVLMNQVCSFSRGVEYEYSSPGDSDVEILVIQEKGYNETIEQLTPSEAINAQPVNPYIDQKAYPEKVSTGKAESEALRLSEERAAKQRERLSRTGKADRAPLPGQNVPGVNLKPLGPGGLKDE